MELILMLMLDTNLVFIYHVNEFDFSFINVNDFVWNMTYHVGKFGSYFHFYVEMSKNLKAM